MAVDEWKSRGRSQKRWITCIKEDINEEEVMNDDLTGDRKKLKQELLTTKSLW